MSGSSPPGKDEGDRQVAYATNRVSLAKPLPRSIGFGKFDSRLARYVEFILAEIFRLEDSSPIGIYYWEIAFLTCFRRDSFRGCVAIRAAAQWLAQIETGPA